MKQPLFRFSEWKLNGQMITLTLPLQDMVSVIKARLNDELSMPPAKQKLQIENIFLKDSNSLAFYNLTPGRLNFRSFLIWKHYSFRNSF